MAGAGETTPRLVRQADSDSCRRIESAALRAASDNLFRTGYKKGARRVEGSDEIQNAVDDDTEIKKALRRTCLRKAF